MIRKPPFIAIASLLLLLGFSATSLVSYVVANNSLNQHIRTNTLPLTSDNIYSEIQRDLLQPILVSSLMAQDTFVQDWVLSGEQDERQIIRYLKSIQERYQTETAFFVSESSRNYYHPSGIIKQINADNPLDSWYFHVAGIANDFEINLDVDTANPRVTTLFVNHKIIDIDNNYLGVIGVGLASESIMELIETYQARYGRQVYFIDRQGNITLRGSQFSGADSIRKIKGLQDIATQILTSPGGSYSYQRAEQQVFLKTRLVPELDWFLLVEQEQHAEENVQIALWINLALSLSITVLVILLVHFTLGRYQKRLERMANTDLLTGTASRHAFETTFEQMLNFAKRRKQPLSVLLIDIDHFKTINDNHGHLLGDEVIRSVANILTSNLRQSDAICRWGGDEFMILLPECSIESAQILAEKMRRLIEESLQVLNHKQINVTASFGIAEFNQQESASNLFARVDKALYQTKTDGRNKVTTTAMESASYQS